MDQPGCCTLITHGFFAFSHPAPPFGPPADFTASFRPPISLLSRPTGLPLADLSAEITTVALPPPTTPANIKHLPAMFAPHLHEQQFIHEFQPCNLPEQWV